MAFTLPYQFDTTTVFRGVIKGAMWLEVVVVGLVAGWLAIKIFRHSEGSIGTITGDDIAVERAPAIFGARLPGPAGRFAISQFAAVRAEEAFGPVGTGYAPRAHARIYKHVVV